VQRGGKEIRVGQGTISPLSLSLSLAAEWQTVLLKEMGVSEAV